MKHLLSTVVLYAIILSLVSCGNKTEENSAWQKERDSLQNVNAQQKMILDNITNTMAEISQSLDSIAMQESMIIQRIDEEGNPLSKKGLKSKIATLTEIIKNQRERMAALEEEMNNGNSSVLQLKSIIAYLNASLEQKEIKIQQLRAEIESKNFSIAQLNTHVSNLKDTVANVRQTNEEQKKEMERQNVQHEKAINEVYYIIGNKAQLINSGVLSTSGSIFKKSKINFASIDKSVLVKADKRTLKEITIEGKSPKILSEEPSGSYSLEKGESSSTLTILDSEKFWNTNNRILVIQIK